MKLCSLVLKLQQYVRIVHMVLLSQAWRTFKRCWNCEINYDDSQIDTSGGNRALFLNFLAEKF